MSSPTEVWSTTTVGDLGRVVTGGTPSSTKKELFGSTYPFITPTDIDDSSRYIKTARFLSEDGRKDQIRRILPQEAICFVCIGATIGKLCMTDAPSFTNQQINSVVVDPNHYDADFVYYLLRTKREIVKSIAGGTATPIVNKSAFSGIKVSVPPLPHQNKISSVLSAYDDLIENNLRRIKILEETAQLLYREWFVNLRFPGHKKVKWLDSPLEKLPENWSIKKLGEAIELLYGKALREEDRKEGTIQVIGSSGVVGTHSEILAKGPGIVVGRKGNVGSVHWIDRDFWPIDTVFYVSTKLPLAYVYFNLQNQGFINSDSAVPGLSRNQAYSLPFLCPQESIVDEFNKIVTVHFALISTLKAQNDNLRQTRDLLLPKLISGQLDVADLDIKTSKDLG